MDLKEVKKVIDCSIYNPSMRKDAKDFVDAQAAALDAARDALSATIVYMKITMREPYMQTEIDILQNAIAALAALRGQEAGE